jgi:uncharacterized protein (DUF2062 family)
VTVFLLGFVIGAVLAGVVIAFLAAGFVDDVLQAFWRLF